LPIPSLIVFHFLENEVVQNDFSDSLQQGGLGKAHQLFGDELPKLLDELNEVLAE